jgi:predicted Rossmann fold flavoprotein
LSGPAILQISSYWQMQEYGGAKKRPISLNLLPDDNAASWLAQHRHSPMLLANLLAEKLPRRFAHEWCALQGCNRPLAELSNKALDLAIAQLDNWELMPSGTLGYTKAEVTLGGVDTRALSSKTMETSSVAGLFFIGEVLDVTGWLGGYNFQWAWSSGWVAGQYA